jgi:hypothetical protein
MTTKQELEQLKKQFAELEAKIAQEEKQEIKTVEDAFNKLKPEWYINAAGEIGKYKFPDEESLNEDSVYNHNQCNMTSEKEAKRMKALIQLRRNAEAMNEGVKKKAQYFIATGYFVSCIREELLVPIILFPTFNTKKLAQQALTNFKTLFEDLYAS